jgi:hypothetical protein
MTGRRALVGLSLLCALVFSAFAASSASAATSGLTAVTCKAGAAKDFSRAHCAKADAVTPGTGIYGHFKIAEKVETVFTGTNEGTEEETKKAKSAILHGISGGVELEITCANVFSGGTLENLLVGEEHRITIKNLVITYGTPVAPCVVKRPVGKGCLVKGGIITTNKLHGTSVGAGDGLKFTAEPAGGGEGGNPFFTLTLEGCTVSGLNKAYEFTGSIPAKFDGATLVVNLPRNAESTLEFGGQKGGLTTTETFRMKEGEPIATTTAPFTAS